MTIDDQQPSNTRWLDLGIIERPSALGPVRLRDEFYPLDHRHGHVALQEALRCAEAFIRRLAPGLTPGQLKHAAFVDIETTGLAGGDHAYAFLVGIGTFDNLAFRVRQYFLTQLTDEPAMLAAVANTLERCTHVVTFNGSSFDLPRLSARFAMAGLPNPLLDLIHVDLLIPARRLYSHILDSRRVRHLETHLLKANRQGDVPGSEVENRYTSFLRRRNLRALPPLFEHNSLDVLFLPAFLGYLGRQTRRRNLDAVQLAVLGRWAEEAGEQDVAVEHYRSAMAISDLSVAEAAPRLAKLLEKQGRWEECLAVWRLERASSEIPRKVRALVELARIHERHLKAPTDALSLAQEALDLIRESDQQLRFFRTLPALETRISRLHRRLKLKMTGQVYQRRSWRVTRTSRLESALDDSGRSQIGK